MIEFSILVISCENSLSIFYGRKDQAIKKAQKDDIWDYFINDVYLISREHCENPIDKINSLDKLTEVLNKYHVLLKAYGWTVEIKEAELAKETHN